EGADALQIAQQNNRNVNAGTGAAADRAAGALGPAPTVDQGLADRQLGAYEEALGMSREVLDALLNGPSTAERIGARTLKNQLALARSARGGPGAVQQAMATAQQGAPELQAQAAESARQEEMQRLTAAGNVASNFAQAALGARGQDIDIAKKNVDAATAFTGMIANLTGIQLELDQRNQELLGQLARDVAATGFDYAQLDAQTASAELDRLLTRYGTDEQTRVQVMAIEAEGKISANDVVSGEVGAIGSAVGTGPAAAGKKQPMPTPLDPAAHAAPPPAADEERVAAALGPQPVAPTAPTAPTAPPGPLGVTAVGPVTPPPIEPGSADRSPAAALAPPPVEPGFADRPQQPATIPVTTTDRSTGTQGIDAASVAAVGAATEDANAAAQAAGEAQIASDQAAADLE